MSDIVHMAVAGLLVSVLAPLLLVSLRALGVEPPAPPALVVAPAFVLLHAALTLMPAVAALAPAVLLAGAVLFWTPVLGRTPLSPAGRIVYLFATMPALDLAGVWLVARGDGPGGIAMVVGMVPMGLVAVVLAVRWARAEEAAVAEHDVAPATVTAEGAGRAHS